jgi:glycosyltransferase involved in cell wall biosynthesis
MLKVADALADAGYAVRVVATVYESWAVETDRNVRSRRFWPLTLVDYRRHESPATYWASGVSYRASRAIAAVVGADRVPLAIAARAYGRVHAQLVRAAISEPADLIYGGTAGALAATEEAARRLDAPFALDLEDFHSEEADGASGTLSNGLAARIESSILGSAAFLTTGSAAIAAAYGDRYGVAPTVIDNTFPLPDHAPEVSSLRDGRLRLYWFSQTIGPGRGLEDAVAAMGRANLKGSLNLRGRPLPGYVERLRGLAASSAPHLDLIALPPAAPDAMIDVARGYDVGLALEQMGVPNRRLCLTNKTFTYILAGLAVAMTDTPGQHALGADIGPAARLVAPGDVDALASAFQQWAEDPAALDRSKRAAWDAAVRRWHWEDPLERGSLLDLVQRSLS